MSSTSGTAAAAAKRAGHSSNGLRVVEDAPTDHHSGGSGSGSGARATAQTVAAEHTMLSPAAGNNVTTPDHHSAKQQGE